MRVVSLSTGVAPLMSMTVAMSLAGRPSPLKPPLPPTCRMRPGANITALLVAPTFSGAVALGAPLNTPAERSAPAPPLAAASSHHIWSALMPKTSPLGATQARG